MNYNQLKNYVLSHSVKYYDFSAPSISDAEWDEAYDKLCKLEKAQGWCDADSPSVKVGGSPGKVRHPYTLYSLRKVYEKADIEPFMKICTPKIDGTNLTLIYKRGKLHLALSRGNGETGDDITHLAEKIENIPLKIHRGEAQIVVNGECVTNNDVDNFRNYVSGALGLKDPRDFTKRNIQFIAHDLLNVTFNYTTKMEVAKNMGFLTVMEDKALEYPSDGVVYRCDSWRQCEELGYTSKYPRFAVALKTREVVTATTILKDVLWTIGRTGVASPTAVVDPVILDDATISRVTLHNLEQIETHHLGLGDKIEIERAGGVIPKFLRVIKHSSHGMKITKAHAEECTQSKLKRVGPKLFADEVNATKVVEHFIKTLDIKGLGPASIKKMELTHPTDLFKHLLWSKLGANGTKVEAEIQRASTKPYSLVLASFGIHTVGKRAAKLIVSHIPAFRNLRDIEVVDIKGVGPVMVESILTWLDENEDWVEKLPLQLEEEITLDDIAEIPKRKVCITGKLDMTRSRLSEILDEKGFTSTTSVTKDCYALISGGDNSSSKYKKAVTLNIPVIDYWDNTSNILNGDF